MPDDNCTLTATRVTAPSQVGHQSALRVSRTLLPLMRKLIVSGDQSSHALRPIAAGTHSAVRTLTLTAVTAVFAAGLGFVVGDKSISASPPVSASAPVTKNRSPSLPTTVSVSDQELTNLQLFEETAETKPLVRTVSATGTVAYDQLHLARITPLSRGRIGAIDVAVGDRVTAGERLAILENFELAAARSKVTSAEAAVNQAKTQVATAEAAVARAASLIRTGGMAQSELDARRATAARMEADLQTREAELQQYKEEEARLMPVSGSSNGMPSTTDGELPSSRSAVVAPFAGLVDAISAAPGDTVDPSTHLFTIADISTVWVEANVAESDLSAVQVGDAAEVEVTAYPGRVFSGRVIYISDQIDPMTGSAKVRAAIPNPDGALRVNMFAATRILSPQNREAVLVSNTALQEVDGKSVVFVPTGQGQFAWRVVRTGLVADAHTEITEGLAAGTPIVTDGSYWLKAALMQSTIPDEG
jgi:cobalt-zinc-cadmium efflux system membrane fusion protein